MLSTHKNYSNSNMHELSLRNPERSTDEWGKHTRYASVIRVPSLCNPGNPARTWDINVPSPLSLHSSYHPDFLFYLYFFVSWFKWVGKLSVACLHMMPVSFCDARRLAGSQGLPSDVTQANLLDVWHYGVNIKTIRDRQCRGLSKIIIYIYI